MAGLPTAGVQLIAEGAGDFLSTMEKGARGVTDFGAAAEKAGGGVSSFGQIAIGALREVGAMAVNVAAQGAKALVGFMADSVSVAGDFEAGMNRFSAAAGDGLEAAGLKAADFRDLFLDIGARLPVSTSEVQEAATTLIKGGLDPLILKMGGLESSIQFAAAAGMDLNAAAELSIKQLGTFVPVTASAAEQTAFLASAQDLLVKAAGASTLDVDKLGDAMLAAGGQAKAAGVDYQDFVTTMGLISPAFGSAAEAGTSYKNFLIRLQPATKPATEAMRELGLLTADGASKFFDATGAFIGNAKAAELLKQATQGLSDAERVKYLQTIFGNDAMGAAIALAGGGAQAYEAFAAKMAAANGVQAQAITVQQGFNIAMDNFKGSVEALQIRIGTMLLPVLTNLFNNVLAPGINILSEVAKAFEALGKGDTFTAFSILGQIIMPLNQRLGEFVVSLGLASDPLATLVAAINTAVPGFSGFLSSVAAIGGALGNVVGALLSVIPNLGGAGTAAGVLSSIFQTVTPIFFAVAAGINTIAENIAILPNLWAVAGVATGSFGERVGFVLDTLLGTGDAFQTIGGKIQGFVTQTILPLGAQIAGVLGQVAGVVMAAINAVIQGVQQSGPQLAAGFAAYQANVGVVAGVFSSILGIVSSILSQVAGFVTTYGAETVAAFVSTWSAVQQTVASLLGAVASLVQPILAQIQTFIQNHGAEIQAAFATTWQQIASIVQTTLAILNATVVPIITAIFGAVGRFITAHGAEIQSIMSNSWTAITTIISTALSVIQGGLQVFLQVIQGDWSGAWQTLQSINETVMNGILTVVQAALSNLATVFSVALDATIDVVSGFVGSFSSVGGDLVRGMIDGVRKAASGLASAAAQAAKDALNAAKRALGISSPSAEAANEVGVPFNQGIAQGIIKSVPILTRASATAADEVTQTSKDDFGRGGSEAGSEWGRGAGGEIERASEKVAKSGKKSVTKAAQEIKPTAAEQAAKEIGSPFTRGIIEGVLKATPDLFKELGKTKDDMLKVFDDLGDKISKSIKESLGAVASMARDAGNAWASVLTAVDPQGAIAAAQRVADAIREVSDLDGERADAQRDLATERVALEQQLHDIAEQSAEARAAEERRLAELRAAYDQNFAEEQMRLHERDAEHARNLAKEQATIKELEDDRQDQLAKAKTAAQRAQINEEFDERRQRIQERINELNREYTADRETSLTQIDELGRQYIANQQEAAKKLAALEAERVKAIAAAQNASDEKRAALLLRIKGLEDKIATAKRAQDDAQTAQFAAIQALTQKRLLAAAAQDALRGLGDEAARIADPRKRAEFLRMRESQIQELLDAQLALEDAQAAIATPGGDAIFEAQQLEAAQLRLAFIQRAQEAERQAFEAGLVTALDEGGTAIGEGVVQAVLAGLGTIGQQFATTIQQALAGIRIEGRAAGGPVSGGQPYLVGERGPELMIPRSAGRIQPLARPAQMARAAMAAGGGNTYNYNLSVATQQSVGSVRAEFGLMQVLAGA